MAFMEEFQHLKIQLQDILSATNNFDNTRLIGSGGFGKVYVGLLSRYKDRSVVAFKRLDRKLGQGDPEFWKEIMMLSRYTHDNLIALLGFCNEGDEMVLVYEHASRGSLDRHLNNAALTWTQRLQICLGAAKGLSYLHGPNGEHQRVLHCDIKSANILLDENLNAKVSDFGLAKIGPANQQYSLLITSAVGTPGYCDPVYMETYSLTKESDVYSFGVVLFEVLCGRPCYEYMNNGRLEVLVPRWKQSYEEKKLEEIIFRGLNEIRPSSLEAFADIAYQCLHKAREKRPTMAQVVEKLWMVLQFEFGDILKLPKYCKEIISFRSVEELDKHLSKGFLLNHGKTWLSLNEKGQHCELISTEECVIPNEDGDDSYSSWFDSRFPMGCYRPRFGSILKIHARPQFLEPQITYKVNLVCKAFLGENDTSKLVSLCFEYKLEGDENFRTSFLIHGREDGWYAAELCRFTSNTRNDHLEILFSDISSLVVEGIEFQPLIRM